MKPSVKRSVIAGLAALAAILIFVPGPAGGQSPDPKTPTLYVVGYAHLDTEWRWDYPTTAEFSSANARIRCLVALSRLRHMAVSCCSWLSAGASPVAPPRFEGLTEVLATSRLSVDPEYTREGYVKIAKWRGALRLR